VAQFDAKTVHKNDWGVIGGGALVLIASFLPWWSFESGPFKVSWSGWDSKFLAWFGILCAIAAAAIVVMRVMGVDLPKLQVGWRTIVLGLAGLSALLILLRFLLNPGNGVDLSRGIGLFLGLIGSIVAAVFAYLAFAESGERADIDRMRADRAANRPATAGAGAGAGATSEGQAGYAGPPAGYAPPPPAPPAGYGAPQADPGYAAPAVAPGYGDTGRASAGYGDTGRTSAGYGDTGQTSAGYGDTGETSAGYGGAGQTSARYGDTGQPGYRSPQHDPNQPPPPNV
jgi:hypothetical protein